MAKLLEDSKTFNKQFTNRFTIVSTLTRQWLNREARFDMEIIRNKASGKYFIIISDNENGTGLMITPTGEVKGLEFHLFDPVEIIDPQDAFTEKLLTGKQINKYDEYLDTLMPRS